MNLTTLTCVADNVSIGYWVLASDTSKDADKTTD